MQIFQMWDQIPGTYTEQPVLEYYPAKEKKSSTTIVIFPGGGYCCRAPHEGEGYAEFLNAAGFDAFVCEYRVNPQKFPLPLLDARRAVRYVRYHAADFGIDPNRICVMGSSAGGHLAAFVSTYQEKIEFEGSDEIDKVDYLPNGQILCYPVISFANDAVGHIGSKLSLLSTEDLYKSYTFSPELIASVNTPPAFIWHTANDDCVNVKNSYLYASKLRELNVPVEMHIFPFGPHGLGVAAQDPHVAQWTALLIDWLKYIFR